MSEIRPFFSVCLVALALTACSSEDPAPAGGGVTVDVQPPWAAVPVGGDVGFTATVQGTANTSVTWSVVEAGCGSVTQGGLYTAPASVGTCTVRVTSNADPAVSDSAPVTVTPGAGAGLCAAAPGQLFPPSAPWNVPVDLATLDAESATIIAYLAANHTAAARFSIVYDFNILYANASTPHRSFTQTGDFYTPDCDPAPIPVPEGGRLEGHSNYDCVTGGDCHLTVIDTAQCRLHEMWRADIAGGTASGTPFYGGCQAIWDLSTVPPPTGRGDFCTSADAAGLPILPLVFTADEVAAGEINHALRFILPNNRIRHHIYVRPGTHSTGATAGPAAAPPYAARLRLKASKDISALSPGAQVVARALKKYGMFLADGGNITFTAARDDLTTHKWAEVGMDANSLKSLSWNDFEVVELGTRLDYATGSCSRTPITQ